MSLSARVHARVSPDRTVSTAERALHATHVDPNTFRFSLPSSG